MKYCSIGVVHYSRTDDWPDTPDASPSRSAAMKRSLESLIENTDYPAEIIVFDNGGNPDDSEYLLNLAREKKISTYVRYADNMSFAFAWNQFLRIASGDYLCFTCNDIVYEKGWLGACISLLEKYSDRKLIAAPYITPDKDKQNFNKEVLEDARINSMAGSNCMIMTPEVYKDIGEMPHYRIGGSVWHRMMVRAGYLVIIPPKDMVNHIGYRKGVDWRRPTDVSKTLLHGKADFNYRTVHKSIFGGNQKPPGIKL